jgi:type III secretion protein N (ATPase)
VLSRELGQAGHYPAIDLLASASRVFGRVAGPAHRADALRLRALMAKHAELKFLLQVGEYRAGSDALGDDAIARWPAILQLLRQPAHEPSGWDDTLRQLRETVA